VIGLFIRCLIFAKRSNSLHNLIKNFSSFVYLKESHVFEINQLRFIVHTFDNFLDFLLSDYFQVLQVNFQVSNILDIIL